MRSEEQDKRVLLDLEPAEMGQFLQTLGEPAFRAKQIYQWIYGSLVFDFEQMRNLPTPLRRSLGQHATIMPLTPVRERADDDGMTYKALLQLPDGRSVESVLMLYDDRESETGRRTVCVSSQVGCAIGCPFCATGQSGFERNLSAGEIVAQVLFFAQKLARGEIGKGKVTNVVFMGQGEPLANLAAVWKAVEILNSPYGFNLGSRHMTISTAGLTQGILELAHKPQQVGLAVSLHAPNDRLRNRLVPINKTYPLARLMQACKEYISATNRRITFEYALIHNVNDSMAHARELTGLLRGLLCHVNLIPLNPTAGEFERTPRQQVLRFQSELTKQGIPTTVRVERGAHIAAACGQLKCAVQNEE